MGANDPILGIPIDFHFSMNLAEVLFSILNRIGMSSGTERRPDLVLTQPPAKPNKRKKRYVSQRVFLDSAQCSVKRKVLCIPSWTRMAINLGALHGSTTSPSTSLPSSRTREARTGLTSKSIAFNTVTCAKLLLATRKTTAVRSITAE